MTDLDETEHDTLEAPVRYELTNRDREMLELERLHWRYSGTKESEISRRWGISHTVYAQRILWLIDQPAAEEYDPQNVRRLRRLRDLRKAQRTASGRGVTV